MSLFQRYRPAFVSAAIFAVFVVLIAVVAAVVPNPHTASDNIAATPVRSLLLQIRDDEKRGVAAVIISEISGTKPRVNITDVPSDLSLTLPDGLQVNLADVTVPPYPQQAVEGLRTTAGIGVDGQLVLERLGFAGMVDYVGGVNVTVDAPFITTTTDLQDVSIAPGLRNLRGIDALAYLGEGNPQLTVQQRSAHLRQVLERLLQRLPADPFKMKQMLVAAGLGARSSVPTDELSDLLVLAARSARRHSQVWSDLPVIRQRVGVAQVALVDQAMVPTLIAGKSLPTTTAFGDMPEVRVIVRDATGVPDAAVGMREALAQIDGVAAVADRLGATRTAVARTRFIARDGTNATITAIAEALELQPTTARPGQLPAGVDALVIVGTDMLTALRQGL
ncbi:MAG: hypothetical protein RL745_579 [Actinomycetota bacterium]|jgi:anionic cell wall polymer biosynthesis LytR-Cps2A-Psr (LCP) family protein